MPPTQPTPRASGGRPVAALMLAAAGLAIAALALADHLEHQRRREALAERLAAIEIPATAAGAVDQALRQGDPTHRELAVARAFVGAERTRAPGSEEERAALQRLETARQLAAEAVAARPAAWEASLLLGAATYLAWSDTLDPRLASESAAWDLPLARAHQLAPTAAEPARFSAVAYLETWPMLSPEKRELARALLRRALVARRSGGLVATWIAVVDDPREAMELFPEVPAVWAEAQRTFADRGDWTSAIEARRRWHAAQASALAAHLDAAAELRDHSPDDARRAALAVLVDAPPELRFLPLVERALREAPAGPPEGATTAGAHAWLEWALDLALVGVETLPAPLLARLAGLAGDLPPTLAARAALAADRPEVAVRIEREAGAAAAGEPWGGYWISRADHLARRGDAAGAAEALDRVVGHWRQGPVHDVVAERVATAADDGAALTAARRRLAARSAEIDLRHPVSQGERTARFAVFSSRPVEAIAVEVGEGHAAALLELQLDGRLLEVFRARSGRRLEVSSGAGRGLHLVELTAASGRPAQIRRLAAVP